MCALLDEGAWTYAWVGAGSEPASPLSLGFAGSTLSYPSWPQVNGQPLSFATLQVLLRLLLSYPRGMIDSAGICTCLLRFINGLHLYLVCIAFDNLFPE